MQRKQKKQSKETQKGQDIKSEWGFACGKAQGLEPFLPESHRNSQEQQVFHTLWFEKEKSAKKIGFSYREQ